MFLVKGSFFTFDVHIHKVISKVKQALGFIRRSFKYLEKNILTNIFLSFSYLEMKMKEIYLLNFIKHWLDRIYNMQI